MRLLGATGFAILDERITLIDAGLPGSLPLLRRALARRGRAIREIATIAITHAHPDHLGGAAAVSRASGARVGLHSADMPRLRRWPGRWYSPAALAGMLIPRPVATRAFEDGDELPALGGLRIVHTPGHTPGSVCLFAPARRVVFAGDALWEQAGALRPPNRWWSDDLDAARESVARLARLDVDTIFLGHRPPLHRAREALTDLISRWPARTAAGASRLRSSGLAYRRR